MRPYRPLQKRPAAAPRLSLCMIVKNEAATLDKCLALARPHVDEIVIVDTGSTDGTREIARRYADVYDEIAWPGSFSQARNYSLDQATGDFILILDGDEWIEGDEGWTLVRAALGQPDLFLARLPVRNVLGEGLLQSDRFYQERIFRNHPLIRYQGRVHNQIVDGLAAYRARFGGQHYDVEAEITHVGYAGGVARKKDKYAPRVVLLEREMTEAPTPELRAYYRFQLAVVRLILEQPADALALVDGLDFGLLTPENAYYAHQIAVEAAFNTRAPGPAAVHGDAMLALNRDEPVGYYVTGLALLELGHAREGVLMLAEAARVNTQRGHRARFRLNTPFVLGKIADLFAGTGLERQSLLFRKVAAQTDNRDALADALLEQLQRELLLEVVG